jgi:metal-dependent amidase/aminoacylase/carboxypeptidase family protein
MSVLAGTALVRLKDRWKGTLYLVGTPAEEAEGAKLQMAESGVFDEMDIAIMIHVGSGGVARVNMEVLSLRSYTVSFSGQTAHAAACPWSGRNALTAARKFLDLLDSRRDSFHPFAIASSIILEGGRAPNVVPDHAAVRLELRADSLERLEEMDRITRNCARGAAIALDCTESFAKDFMDFYDMIRVPALEERLGTLLAQAGETLVPVEGGGSSDVGNVSYRCPTIQPMLCITKEDCAAHTVALRDATVSEFGLSQMRKGAGIISETILDIFNRPEFREQVKKDFKEAKKSKMQAT